MRDDTSCLCMCCRYDGMDNVLGGLYIAPAFMDKLVVHITKNFLSLPNIKVSNPLHWSKQSSVMLLSQNCWFFINIVALSLILDRI